MDKTSAEDADLNNRCFFLFLDFVARQRVPQVRQRVPQVNIVDKLCLL